MTIRMTYWFALAACSSPATPSARFANAPPVWIVNDRRDVPRPPEKLDTETALYHFDGSFHRRITRALELPREGRALGINAFDEVPDSTWFTNRIGVRPLSPEEIYAGPTEVGSPESHVPWTISHVDWDGETLHMRVTDARGGKYLVKFDRKGFPEVETASHVIVNRLIWACGYNVPEDHIAYVRPRDLVIADRAVIHEDGDDDSLDRAALEGKLAMIEHDGDGRIRVMASRIVDGKPLGGHLDVGVRRDDPNDRIPHELRRDLRGAQPIYAWLDHVDIKEDNLPDFWVADPVAPGRHYVAHYLIDFGKSLGAMAALARDPRRGHMYKVDFGEMLASYVTFGMRERSWEDRPIPQFRGIGVYEATTYDPAKWKADTPAYTPLRTSDNVDKLWGAKLLIRFTPDQLRAAIRAGQLTDPRSAEYLLQTLIARQRSTARHWFGIVAPLDRFRIDPRSGSAVCFDDLMLTYGLAGTRETRYAFTPLDRTGRAIGQPAITGASPNGRTCSAPLALAADGDGYTIVKIETHRPDFSGATFVHVARAPHSNAARVIGIYRL
jgi:hypothetical protein